MLSLVVVFTGSILYLLFRPVEPLFFDWFRGLGLESWLMDLRSRTLPHSHMLPAWMVFSLPAGLWSMAYTMLIGILWSAKRSKLRILWYLSIPVLLFGVEILQLSGFLQGTFCWKDMLFTAAGIAAGLLSVTIISRN